MALKYKELYLMYSSKQGYSSKRQLRFTKSYRNTLSFCGFLALLMGVSISLFSGAVATAAPISAQGSVAAIAPYATNNYVVTTIDDSSNNTGSLRYALAQANSNGGGTISFNLGTSSPATITLASALPTISTPITVTGPGANLLTINGNNVTGIFSLSASPNGCTPLTCQLNLSGVTLANAVGSGNGGAINNNGGRLNLTSVTLTHNKAANGIPGSYNGTPGSYGGAIYNSNGGVVTITNSTFSFNSAGNGADGNDGGCGVRGGDGGAIYNNGVLTIINSTFTSNSAGNGGNGSQPGEGGNWSCYSGDGGNGGAIFNNNIATITNVTLASNSGGNGGIGIFYDGYGANGRSGSGGAIYNATTLRIGSSIIANNLGGDIFSNYANATSQNYNLIGNGTNSGIVAQSGDKINRNPDLDTVKNNGGPTQTILPKKGSPAIDAIPAANCGITTDQRGVARPQNGNCDIGAVEVQPTDSSSSYNALAPVVANSVNTSSTTGQAMIAHYSAYLRQHSSKTTNNSNSTSKANASQAGIDFTTYLSVENTNATSTNITITYYSLDGSVIATDNNKGQAIAPHGVYLAPQMLAAGQVGSAIVTSDEPVKVLVAGASSEGNAISADSYEAIDLDLEQGSTIYAPIALNNAYGGFSTTFMVDNVSSTPAVATVTYYNNTGSAVLTQSVQLKAFGEALIDQTQAQLPQGFAGWATISSDAGQSLVGQVLESNLSTNFYELVDMTGDTSATVYIPVVFQHAFGNFNTGMQLVNPNPVTATVSVTYYRQDGVSISNVVNGDGEFEIAPYGSVAFYHGSGFPELNTSNGGFVGAAIVTSDQPLLGLVNQAGSVNNVSYNGTFGALHNVGSTVSLPSVFKNSNGFTSGLQIVNVSSTASTATLTYYDDNGNQVYQTKLTEPNGKPIVPGGVVDVYLGAENHLPDNFSGLAVITADDEKTGFIVVTNNASNQVFYTYASNS